MTIKISANEIWSEVEKSRSYKQAMNLYDIIKRNQDFVLGNQWEGVNAPDIEKPVINILRQAVDYYASMIVSDDIGVSVEFPEDMESELKNAIEYIITNGITKVIEEVKFKAVSRKFITDCATDGTAVLYFYYDMDKNTEATFKGSINMEMVDILNLGFANPAQSDIQKQAYITIIQKLPVDEVKEMAKANDINQDDIDNIKEDSDSYNNDETNAKSSENYVTLVTKLFKVDKSIHAIKCTKDIIVMKEVDMKVKLYPVAYMAWRSRKNSYIGVSPVTAVIPNQIMINKFHLMVNEFQRKLAFPKLIYDSTKIPKGWSNAIGALAVNGDVTDAVASISPTVQLSPQTISWIENLMDKTKETLGVYEVALGNARPENTSAIVALQKSASQPLELQKLAYYQMVEDSVRIMLDLMAGYYGVRPISIRSKVTPEELQVDPVTQQQLAVPMQMPEGGMVTITKDFDYADIAPDKVSIQVEIGASAYWSELMQINTLDNMYGRGIIPDPITYIEQLPKGILKSPSDIIEAIKKKQAELEQQQADAQAQSMMQVQPGAV